MEETKKKMKGKVVFKHETEANWLKSNYVPDEGEMILYDEDDNYSYKRTKYGNGKDKVRDLPFSISVNLLENGEGDNSIQQQDTGAEAKGQYAIALGQNAKALTQNSIAIGLGVTTPEYVDSLRQNRDQMVVGRYNKILPGADTYGSTTGARFIVGIGTGEDTFSPDGSILKEYRKNGLVVWGDGRVTIGENPVEAMDVATKNYVDTSIMGLVDSAPEALNTLNELAIALTKHEDAYDALLETVGNKADKDYVDDKISNIDIPETADEWDYVIDKLEDFTTAKLATMSGRVLVKEVNYLADGEPWDMQRLELTIPSKVSEIKFVNSSLYAILTGSKNTRIVGFKSSNFDGYFYSQLKNFGSVEFCGNEIEVFNCQNVRHCNIRRAMDCTNLSDIEIYADYYDGEFESFNRCKVIDNVRFKSGGSLTGIEAAVEFVSCTNISNIHNLSPDFTTIQYRDCTYVDGDTCDGYYTEEDVGKVRVITADGTLQTIEIGADDDAPTGEWDYIITNVSDFLGAPLSEMSGNVLVKGVNISEPGFEVDVNADIKTIKFVDCEIRAKITAKGTNTAIIGLLWNQAFTYTTLSNFNRVEHCYGFIEVNKCSNVVHCRIAKAIECTNLQDIECSHDVEYASDIAYTFDRCNLIDGVRISSLALYGESEGVLEFNNCSHLSNISRFGSQTVINYVGCTYVDGDTCDGYYTSTEAGKVQKIAENGASEFISVYSQEEIDGMLGDIDAVLDQIIAKQNVVIGGDE